MQHPITPGPWHTTKHTLAAKPHAQPEITNPHTHAHTVSTKENFECTVVQTQRIFLERQDINNALQYAVRNQEEVGEKQWF